MDPTAANLTALVGSQLTLDPKLSLRAPDIGSGAMVKQYGCTIEAAGGAVAIKQSDAGDGMWVPYAEGQAVVGYASGAQVWVASELFSGCEPGDSAHFGR